MKTPDYYLPIMPYLIIDGANDFLDFLKAVFNAKEEMLVHNEDGSIMHGEVIIGKAVVMIAQSQQAYKPLPSGMFMEIKDVDKTYNKAIEKGSISLQEPDTREYGYSAGFQDPFGNQWWITNMD